MERFIFALTFLFVFAPACDSSSKRELKGKLEKLSFPEITSDPAIHRQAIALGRSLYESQSCGNCHGLGGEGNSRFGPSLIDGKWAWGGSPNAIFATLKYGVRVRTYDRDTHRWRPVALTRWAIMPEFAGLLGKAEIQAVARVTEKLMSGEPLPARSSSGTLLFEKHCALCHGKAGEGISISGTPPLTRRPPPQLEPGEKALADWIAKDGNGATAGQTDSRIPVIGMPAWGPSMTDGELRALTLYLLSQFSSGK